MSYDRITGEYGLSWGFESEGNQLYLVSCLTCGATIITIGDDGEESLILHDRWHEKYSLNRGEG